MPHQSIMPVSGATNAAARTMAEPIRNSTSQRTEVLATAWKSISGSPSFKLMMDIKMAPREKTPATVSVELKNL